jgi:hypothetical protein
MKDNVDVAALFVRILNGMIIALRSPLITWAAFSSKNNPVS